MFNKVTYGDYQRAQALVNQVARWEIPEGTRQVCFEVINAFQKDIVEAEKIELVTATYERILKVRQYY